MNGLSICLKYMFCICLHFLRSLGPRERLGVLFSALRNEVKLVSCGSNLLCGPKSASKT